MTGHSSKDESLESTLRQILQQKWSSIEHYDRQDQNLLVSVFALGGAALTLAKLDNVGPDKLMAVYWFAVLLAAGATAAVLRSFVEYYRSLGVISRVEQALRVYEIVGERPSFPDNERPFSLFVGVVAKLLRTWRVFLLAIYGVIGVMSASFASGVSWKACCIGWLIYLVAAYVWLVFLPLRN